MEEGILCASLYMWGLRPPLLKSICCFPCTNVDPICSIFRRHCDATVAGATVLAVGTQLLLCQDAILASLRLSFLACMLGKLSPTSFSAVPVASITQSPESCCEHITVWLRRHHGTRIHYIHGSHGTRSLHIPAPSPLKHFFCIPERSFFALFNADAPYFPMLTAGTKIDKPMYCSVDDRCAFIFVWSFEQMRLWWPLRRGALIFLHSGAQIFFASIHGTLSFFLIELVESSAVSFWLDWRHPCLTDLPWERCCEKSERLLACKQLLRVLRPGL